MSSSLFCHFPSPIAPTFGQAYLYVTGSASLKVVDARGGKRCAHGGAPAIVLLLGLRPGSREFIRETRASKPDDLLNSVAGGIMSGALLGRLQGGQLGAIRYSILFAAAGTTVDFAMLRLKPVLEQYNETFSKELKKLSDGKMPEWSPIQILDEEALAKKHAREQQLYAQRLGKLSKEES